MQNFADYQSFLAKKGCKPSTIRTHTYSLRRVIEDASSGSLATINTFFKKNKHLKNKTLNHHIASVRLYGQMVGNSELQSIPFLKEEEYIKSVMSDEEIEAFLKLPKPNNTKQSNWNTWTLFFSIMAFSGMRPNEVAHLTTETCDLGQNVFRIEDSKTNTPRMVPIAENIKEPLVYKLKEVRSGYLFPSKRGGDHGYGQVVDNVDWHYNFHTRIKRLGIVRKNLTPYSLRHSWITTMLSDDSVKMFDVKRIVGHKQTATTEHYYAYTMKNLQRTVNKHPIARRQTDPKFILKALKDAIDLFQLEDDPRLEVSLTTGSQNLSLIIKIKD